MLSRWLTFLVWAVAAASGVFWGLWIGVRPEPLPDTVQVPAMTAPTGGDWGQVLGVVRVAAAAEPVPVAESSRFALQGVVAAPAGAANGLALVSVGGAPAKVWRVGQAVEGSTVLLAVGQRSAEFGPAGGPTRFTLNLPMLAQAMPSPVGPGMSGGAAGSGAMPSAAPMTPGTPPGALPPGRGPAGQRLPGSTGPLGMSKVVGPTVPGGIGPDGEASNTE